MNRHEREAEDPRDPNFAEESEEDGEDIFWQGEILLTEAVVHRPTAELLLSMAPTEAADLGLENVSHEDVLRRTSSPEIALGPPWVRGFLVYSGDTTSLQDFIAKRRFELGDVTREEIHLNAIGDSRHREKFLEESLGPQWLGEMESDLELLEEGSRKHGGIDHHMLMETARLSGFLDLHVRDLPCISFLSFPRWKKDAILQIPPELTDSPAGLRHLSFTLQEGLGKLRDSGALAPNRTNKEIIEATDIELQRIHVSLKNEVASASSAIEEDGWGTHINLLRYRWRADCRVVLVPDDEYNFNPEQAKVVRHMIRQACKGRYEIPQEELVRKTDREVVYLSDLFKRHPAYMNLIQRVSRGVYRLKRW